MRQADPAFSALPVNEQYRRAGEIAGVIARSDLELEIVLTDAKPQILYFFAMPFTTPVPWEAVAYYNGQHGREHFADHPVGTGPYRLAIYEKQYRMVLERNAAWYGSRAALTGRARRGVSARDRQPDIRGQADRRRLCRPAPALPGAHQLRA